MNGGKLQTHFHLICEKASCEIDTVIVCHRNEISKEPLSPRWRAICRKEVVQRVNVPKVFRHCDSITVTPNHPVCCGVLSIHHCRLKCIDTIIVSKIFNSVNAGSIKRFRKKAISNLPTSVQKGFLNFRSSFLGKNALLLLLYYKMKTS